MCRYTHVTNCSLTVDPAYNSDNSAYISTSSNEIFILANCNFQYTFFLEWNASNLRAAFFSSLRRCRFFIVVSPEKLDLLNPPIFNFWHRIWQVKSGKFPPHISLVIILIHGAYTLLCAWITIIYELCVLEDSPGVVCTCHGVTRKMWAPIYLAQSHWHSCI